MTAIDVFNFIWLSASLSAFGIALFPFYAGTAPTSSRQLLRQLGAVIGVFATITTAQHVSVMEATLEQIAGTSIGRVWISQIVIAALLALSAWRGPNWLVALLAGAEVAGFAFIGHANAIAGTAGALIEMAHLLAAGAWLGGVIALAFALRGANVATAVARFSWAGIAFVTVIGVTAVALLLTNTGTALPITQMRYGRLALTKIVLFAAALGCAAFNRFVTTPRADWRTMMRVIAGELALLTAIVAIAILLAQNEPYG
ncbi:MAG: CopD family protein [Terricaulis sp.]